MTKEARRNAKSVDGANHRRCFYRCYNLKYIMTLQLQRPLISQGRKEFLIVFGVMTFVFLPIRLMFVQYVSTDWYSSFGVISAIAVIMVILTKKGKLGRFGKMFENQMMKLHTGKRQKIIYLNLAFSFVVLSGLIICINLGDTIYKSTTEQIVKEAGDQLPKMNELDKVIDKITPEQILEAIVLLPQLFIYKFGVFASLWAVENQITGGMLLHFSSVFLVETIEVIGVLTYYKYAFRNVLNQSK